MNKSLKSLGEALSEIVFPRDIYCIACGKPIKKESKMALCSECRTKMLEELPERCMRCAHFTDRSSIYFCEHCASSKLRYDRGAAAVVYTEQARKIIYGLKYGGKGYLAKNIAFIMSDAVKSIGEYDIIIPVPMHKSKRASRGFCHTTLISKAIGEIEGKPVSCRNLIRVKKTGAMSGLTPEERKRNIKGAFDILDVEEIRGKRVLLIDDLITTGSTAEECARVLKNSGAEKVYLAVFSSPYDN